MRRTESRTDIDVSVTGDERVLSAARDQIRGNFRDKASLSVSDPSVAPAIQRAEEVAAFLRSNLVQGVKESEDTYSESQQRSLRGLTMAGTRDELADGDPEQSYGYTSTPSEATMTRSNFRVSSLPSLGVGAARTVDRGVLGP